MTTIPQHKYHTLDAIRGVAAIAVAIFHSRSYFFASDNIFGAGYLAVDLFFLLSGFVIAHAYDRKLEAGLSLTTFAQLRLARLLPMVWLGLAIGLPLMLVQHDEPASKAIFVTAFNALLIPNFVSRAQLFPGDIPLWSLFFEMIANLGYAIAFGALSKRVILFVIAASALGLVVAALHFGKLDIAGNIVEKMGTRFCRVFFSFLLGVLISRTREIWQRHIPTIPAWALIFAVCAMLAYEPGPPIRPLYDLFFVFIFSPLVVMAGAKVQPGQTSLPIALLLAEISYPLYVLHTPIRNWSLHFASRFGLPTTSLLIAALILSLILAWLAARFYEPRLIYRFKPIGRRNAANIATT